MTPEKKSDSGAPLVRLNKFLADNGVASRRKCDELIADGQVWIDGEPVVELGTKIDPSKQRVEINGVVLKPAGEHRRYYLLNKPTGVVCTNDDKETRRRAIDLVRPKDPVRLFTVGRLDEATTGIVILTNDGEFAHHVMHPRYEVPKTYLVRVHGRISDEALGRVRDGVHLAEGRTAGARVLVRRRSEKSSTLLVTIGEGKNREIRRVFAKVGAKVVDLRRTRIGPVTDRGLKVGHWRALTASEVRSLLAVAAGEGGEEPAPRGSRGRAGKARGRAGQRSGQSGRGAAPARRRTRRR